MERSSKKTARRYTLVLIREGSKVLLGLKKRGFGVGKWNGFGGKIEETETIEDAAKLEVKEECGLMVKEMSKLAEITFDFVDDPVLLEMHVFTTENYFGDVIESDEMRPQWFEISEIPYELMWVDAKHWWPFYFKNQPFEAHFKMQDYETILEKNIAIAQNKSA